MRALPTSFMLSLAGFAAASVTLETAWAETSDKDAMERLVVLSSVQDAALVAGSADFISAEDLERQAYSDIHRVLRAIPGVNLQEEDGFGLRPNIGLRGTGLDRSSKITLMEDGILIAPAPYASPSAYYFPRVARMSGVEVVKGPASIKYGPRTQGGSINFTSIPIPEEFSGLIDLRGGSHGALRGHAWVGGNLTEWDGGAIDGVIQGLYDESAGFKELDGGGDTGYRIEDYVGKLAWRSAPGASVKQTLILKAQYSDEISDETYLGLTQADFNADPYRRYRASARDRMDSEHWELSARYFAEFDNGLDLAIAAYRTEFARDWFKIDRVNPAGTSADSGRSGASITSILEDPAGNADAFEILQGEDGFVSADGAVLLKHNNRDYYAQGVQAVLGYEIDWLGAAHDLEAGLRIHRDEMDRYQWFERFRMDNGALVLTGQDVPGTESNRIESAEAIAIYVRDEIEAGRWIVTPGLRFETIDLTRKNYGSSDPARTGASLSTAENTVSVFIPGISALYRATDDLSVFAGVHRGFEPPAPGQSSADAEKSVNWETGLRWAHGGVLTEVTAFLSDYSNIIGTCTASTGGGCSVGDQFSGGEARAMGVEASAAADLDTWLDTGVSIPLTLAYTFTEAEFRSSFESDFDPWGSVEKGEHLPYIPAHQLHATLGLEGEDWGGELSLSHVGEVRTVAGAGAIPQGERVEGHTVVDLAAFHKPGETLKLSIAVRNLFDSDYAVARRPAGLRPGLPRSVIGGVSLTF